MLQAVSSASFGPLSSPLLSDSPSCKSFSSLPCSASPELLPSGLVLSSPGGWKVEKAEGEKGGHGTKEGRDGGHAGGQFEMLM